VITTSSFTAGVGFSVISTSGETSFSRLESLNLHNVTYIIGDGSSGYSKGAPFDRIMVTASPSLVPTVLLDQLAIWGKMVLPLQSDLLLMTKKEDGSIEKQHLLKVAFVPMVGIYE
jgi:protein-L-isoaspartate(D-aspartate) O-methyltransferase